MSKFKSTDIEDFVLDFLQDTSKLSYDIQHIESINRDYLQAKTEFEKVDSVYKETLDYYTKLDLLNKLANKEETNYRQRRLDFLSVFIDSNLSEIFPLEGFTTKINADFKNKRQKVTMTMLDRMGNVSLPRVSEGRFCQQLISFSSAAALTSCLGNNKFYLDEAFVASDSENLTKVGSLLKSLVDRDFQILLIEQKDDVYKDVPRREFLLEKDINTRSVKILDTIDY